MELQIPSWNLPTLNLPNPNKLETVEIPLPTGNVPSYVPLVVPPSDLREPEGTEPEATEEAPTAPSVQLPVLDIQMPLPTAEVVATATYAAVAAVATTTLATPLFDQIKKKLQKFLQGKIDKWKQQRKKKKDSSEN